MIKRSINSDGTCGIVQLAFGRGGQFLQGMLATTRKSTIQDLRALLCLRKQHFSMQFVGVPSVYDIYDMRAFFYWEVAHVGL